MRVEEPDTWVSVTGQMVVYTLVTSVKVVPIGELVALEAPATPLGVWEAGAAEGAPVWEAGIEMVLSKTEVRVETVV